MKSDGSNHSCKHNGLLNTFSYTSHLVNANKKLKTPLTSKDMSHLGKLYMTLFERLEPQSASPPAARVDGDHKASEAIAPVCK